MIGRSWTTGLALCLAVSLAACIGRAPSYHAENWQTPKDPPPIPQRKPVPPAGLVWQDFSVGSVTTAPLATGASQNTVQSVALAPPTAAAVVPTNGRHRVARGQTLFAISRQYGLPIRSLIDSNGLTPPYRLQAGQSLLIPKARVHQVASGDTVYGISRRYGVDLSELVRQNAISAPYRITLGQRLVLPAAHDRSRSQVAALPVPAPKSESSAKALESIGSPQAANEGPPVPKRRPAALGNVLTAKKNEPTAQTAALSSKPAPVPKPPPRAGSKFLWPVQGKVLSRYGPREGGQHNDGINVAAPRGTAVVAAENGVVAYAGSELKGFGNLLLIKHADGWVTAYAHNETLLVRRGQQVRRGQAIARVGSSGNVSRPQLHFEIRKGTRAVDPTRLLTGSKSAKL